MDTWRALPAPIRPGPEGKIDLLGVGGSVLGGFVGWLIAAGAIALTVGMAALAVTVLAGEQATGEVVAVGDRGAVGEVHRLQAIETVVDVVGAVGTHGPREQRPAVGPGEGGRARGARLGEQAVVGVERGAGVGSGAAAAGGTSKSCRRRCATHATCSATS